MSFWHYESKAQQRCELSGQETQPFITSSALFNKSKRLNNNNKRKFVKTFAKDAIGKGFEYAMNMKAIKLNQNVMLVEKKS